MTSLINSVFSTDLRAELIWKMPVSVQFRVSYFPVKVKVNQSHYTPGQAQRVPGS